jgi:hypothetical protein
MEYSETWKEKATPAGRLYWAHTARAHPTSGSGCTGWLTPSANEDAAGNPGTKMQAMLGSQCKLVVGFATPSTRDHKDTGDLENSRFRKDGKERNDTVPRQCAMVGYPTPSCSSSAGEISEDLERHGAKWRNKKTGRILQTNLATEMKMGLGLGATSTSSPSSTEKRGALNPAHSRWLMGYPVAWCQAAISASRMLKQRAKRG